MSSGEIAVIVAAVFLAAVVQVTAGFGFALLAVPIMAAAVDPKVAVVVSTALGLVTSTSQAVIERAHVCWPIARRLLVAALVGMPFGLLVFLVVDEHVLRLALGVAVLGTVVVLVRGVDLRESGSGVDWSAGAVSGVLATSLSTNGPPLVFALQARHLPPHDFRATISVVFAASGVVALAMFAASGQVNQDVVIGIVASIPALALGGAIGLSLRRHVTAERFRSYVLVLMTLAAISAIVAAVRG